MPSNRSLQVEVIDSDEAFFGLRDPWTAFESETDQKNLTSSFAWLRTWWETFKTREDDAFGFQKRLLILVVRSGTRIVGIAPFLRVRRRKRFQTIECIEFLGQQWSGTLLDVLTEKGSAEETCEFLLQWLKKNVPHQILHLRYLPATSPFLKIRSKGIFSLSACPALHLNQYQSFEEYHDKSYSKSLKQNIRTAMNKMRAEGKELTFAVEPVDPASFAEVARLSGSKLTDGKHSLYQDPAKAGFIRSLAEKMDVNILFIILDGVKVSYRLNVFYADRKFCLDASYDRSFPKFELGTISVHESIRDSFSRGLALHCEGTGVDFYKVKFIKDAIRIYTLIAKGNSLGAGIYAWREERAASGTDTAFTAQWESVYR